MRALHLSIVAACLALSPIVAQAQQDLADVICKRAPAERKAACVDFVKTYKWDEGKGTYVRRDNGQMYGGGAVPSGVPSREQIRADRAKFLASNKWDEGKSAWIPLDKAREVCVDKACDKTRDDVERDAQAFMKTHKWDEGKGMYVLAK
jgi:hypothetical protein